MPKVHRTYTALLALLLAFAIGHTLWSTSLDSFTIDEPYHITAGATYLRRGDFRINPEHPPLVKLIAALALPPRVLYVAPFKKIYDKPQERTYTQRAVFLDSNYPQVHRHARFALIAYNTLLMLVLTLLLRRIFGPAVSLWCLLLLALDPTVSAHMPVVMTDLPMALTGTICCALTWLALTGRRWRDWLALGAACGVLLGTKHSAPLIVLPLLCGCIVVLLMQAVRRLRADALPQLGRLAVAALLCCGRCMDFAITRAASATRMGSMLKRSIGRWTPRLATCVRRC